MAWKRTGLAIVINGVLLFHSGHPGLQIAASAIIASGTAPAAGATMNFADRYLRGRPGAVVMFVVAVAVGVLDIIAIVLNE